MGANRAKFVFILIVALSAVALFVFVDRRNALSSSPPIPAAPAAASAPPAQQMKPPPLPPPAAAAVAEQTMTPVAVPAATPRVSTGPTSVDPADGEEFQQKPTRRTTVLLPPTKTQQPAASIVIDDTSFPPYNKTAGALAAIPDTLAVPQPLPCKTYTAKGTIFNEILSGNRSHFQGLPVLQNLPHHLVTTPPSEWWRDFDIVSLCQDYAPKPPPHFTNTPGCARENTNSLVAVRWFNLFDPCQVAEVLRATNTPAATRRCIADARRRTLDTMIILRNKGKSRILQEYAALRERWLGDEKCSEDDRETNLGFFAGNFLQRGATKAQDAKMLQRAAIVDDIGRCEAIRNKTAQQQQQEQQEKRKVGDQQQQEQQQREQPLKKNPTVPLDRRKRLMICAAMQLPLAHYGHVSEARRKPDPAVPYTESVRSFLAATRPSTDELHILTDYSLEEWDRFTTAVRKNESARRKRVRKRFKLSDFYRDNKQQQQQQRENSSLSSLSPSFSSVSLPKQRMHLPEGIDYEEYAVAAPDGKFAAQIFVHDVSTWSNIQLDMPKNERPLSGRVYKVNHFLKQLRAQGEHDGTVSMVASADLRDVMYSANPFDSISRLNLNRFDGAVGERDVRAAATKESAAAGRDYLIRGIAIAAEDQSHQCNMLTKTETPPWEQDFLTREGADRVIYNSRVHPDRKLVPILCSGYVAFSLEAGIDFYELFTRTLVTDSVRRKGNDQGAANVAVYLGLGIAAFPHDIFVLNNPNVSPIRHYHYFSHSTSSVFLESFIFLNCAGFPIDVSHQIDRKVGIWKAYQKVLASRFIEDDPW